MKTYPHKMFKDNKTKIAKTEKEHLILESKGYTHVKTKPITNKPKTNKLKKSTHTPMISSY